jgi:hypothetical protein
MIFSRGSLILGVLVMAVGAQEGGVLDTGPTGVPSSAATTSSTANTPASTFFSNYTIPDEIPLGTTLDYTFMLEDTPAGQGTELYLVLCQTNASGSTPVDSTNSWSVAPLQSKYKTSSIPKTSALILAYRVSRTWKLRRQIHNVD